MREISTRHYRIWRENNVVIALISGQWSDIETKAYSRDFRKIAKPLIGYRWAHITYLDDRELATLDCIPIIKELEGWCIANKLSCDAVIYAENAVKDFVLEQALPRTNKDAAVYRHFTDSAAALQWVSEQGFSPESVRIAV